MTYQEREVKEAFFRGVQVGQNKLALSMICKELGIYYFEVKDDRT